MSQRSNARTPRWVKVLGIIIIVLLLLVAVAVVTGIGGPHGPGRHIPSDSDGSVLPTHVTTGVVLLLSSNSLADSRSSGGGLG